MNAKTDSNDYPFVREYCRVTGSYDYYANIQVAQARKDSAPQTAIFKRTPAPHENWSDRNQRDLWHVFDPTPPTDPAHQARHQAILREVKAKYGLTYEDVAAWDALTPN